MTTIVSYHTRISFQDIKYVNYLGGHTPKSFLVYEDADEEVKRDHLHCVHYLDKKELQLLNCTFGNSVLLFPLHA